MCTSCLNQRTSKAARLQSKLEEQNWKLCCYSPHHIWSLRHHIVFPNPPRVIPKHKSRVMGLSSATQMDRNWFWGEIWRAQSSELSSEGLINWDCSLAWNLTRIFDKIIYALRAVAKANWTGHGLIILGAKQAIVVKHAVKANHITLETSYFFWPLNLGCTIFIIFYPFDHIHY